MRAPLLALALLLGSSAGHSVPLSADCFGDAESIDPAAEISPGGCPEWGPLAERLAPLPLQPPLEALPNVDQLRDAAYLDEGLGHPLSTPLSLDRAALATQLESTRAAAAESWWQQFKRWLRSWMGQGQDVSDPLLVEWLQKLRLSDETADLLINLITLLLVVLALGVVVNELRQLRVTPAGGRRQRPGAATLPLPEAGEGLADPAAIRQLPPRAQAAALWRYAIALLAARGQLSPRRGCTSGEYRRELARALPRLATPFGTLAKGADRALFGPADLPLDLAALHAATAVIEAGDQTEGRA